MSRSQQHRPPVSLSPTETDDAGCPILHVDMDAFYASVELRTRPELRGRPVIVGGGIRGVVLSATYEARAYGVHSAMSMTRALRLCPKAAVVPPSRGVYSEVSAAVMDIFRSFTPLVEPLSQDEAFLNVSGARRIHGRPVEIGTAIRRRVESEQELTCSVGIAASKFVAKLASTLSKPDGMQVVPADRTLDFLHPLPVGALWGVGERTESALLRVGLRTVADVAHAPAPLLVSAVGEASAAHLQALSWGRDARSVHPDHVEKSIGADETFAADSAELDAIARELLRLADRVAVRLRRAGMVGRTVTLKVRYSDFTTITRSRTLPERTAVGNEIYGTARSLLEALQPLRSPVRLVGVRVEGLVAESDAPRQLLLDEAAHGWRDVDRATDAAADRFGAGSVRPATLLEPGLRRLRMAVQAQSGSDVSEETRPGPVSGSP